MLQGRRRGRAAYAAEGNRIRLHRFPRHRGEAQVRHPRSSAGRPELGRFRGPRRAGGRQDQGPRAARATHLLPQQHRHRLPVHRAGASDLHEIARARPRARSAGRAVRRVNSTLGHDPEKWEPVFGKDHAQARTRSHPMNETATLANYATKLRYEDIPQKVLERARNTISDTLGAIVFGYGLPWSQMVVDYATTYGPGGKSRILGPGGAQVQPGMAALANGALAHAFELDGAAKPSAGTHPCATIFPASLAIAQERGFGGKELITAFVAATEVMLRI